MISEQRILEILRAAAEDQDTPIWELKAEILQECECEWSDVMMRVAHVIDKWTLGDIEYLMYDEASRSYKGVDIGEFVKLGILDKEGVNSGKYFISRKMGGPSA